MSDQESLLGYCGLYCADCAGYSGEIADAAAGLAEVLGRYHFDLTARHLFAEQLGNFAPLREGLGFLIGLRCPKVCRAREEGETRCEIHKCCREKGLFACYLCSQVEQCEKLETLAGLHGNSCIQNAQAIRRMGLEAWISHGRRLWFGSNVD